MVKEFPPRGLEAARDIRSGLDECLFGKTLRIKPEEVIDFGGIEIGVDLVSRAAEDGVIKISVDGIEILDGVRAAILPWDFPSKFQDSRRAEGVGRAGVDHGVHPMTQDRGLHDVEAT